MEMEQRVYVYKHTGGETGSSEIAATFSFIASI